MKNRSKQKRIGIIGLWHLGCIYATSLAQNGYLVTGYDLDKKVIDNLNAGYPPILEPGLPERLKKYLNHDLFFSSKPQDSITNQDYVMICLDVPVDNNDRVILRDLHKYFQLVTKYCSDNTVIVVSSQIPVGSTRSLINQLKTKNKRVEVVYFPENLRLGQAFESFLKPERLVLGADNYKTIKKFISDFSLFSCPVIFMSPESAEIVKHALNAYLAVNISFASELGDLCELFGANMEEVISALKTDRRVSRDAPINPGLGFAGGTLGRDLQTLISVSSKKKYNPKLIKSIYGVNQDRISLLVGKIKQIYPVLSNRNIGILGLTYKPHTDTLRRSQSLELASILNGEGANIRAFDPAIKSLKKNLSFIKLCQNLDHFFRDLNLIVLMTPWPQFKKIDPSIIAKQLKNKIIYDCKNFLDYRKFKTFGFQVHRIGNIL
ncbi:hypothetical protein A2960_03210 [Candidatus Gottesmanbacteria bacterium RIFCSPLOWO2_01_FULL_39_12b]|uniref:UDP-glucose 6-dehydrogenase n=1 Tax=Candidatus Gottesmanbacteria bacterium RIFCSPLOWO2_01_FULL_39_12b TaxID=1798388 RepID=A0A1F6AR74_9BACT|nr:MAG: hypothetical protein A2960_03210 [Candidatus Gottesmanbacteria bacterium RIFCSPLOWO2_01_FULL_39_12b]